MNDPTYVEASRALAQRTLLEGGRDEKQRVEYAFRLATARKPTGKEAGVLRHLLKARLSEFQKDRRSAMKLLASENPRAKAARSVRTGGVDDGRERDLESG